MSYLSPETEILHQRYAQALIDIAEEAGKLDEVADNLTFLNELAAEDRLLVKVLHHPEIDQEDKIKAIEAISKKAHFSDEFYAFLKVLIKKDRLNLIHGIFLKYRDIYEKKRAKLKVLIKTAVSLNKGQTARLKEVLSQGLKKDIIVEESIQPSLIGGLGIKIGDLVYNLSLADRLNLMEEKLRG